jgi:hypothetical protein
VRHPDPVRDWHSASNTLVLLAVPDERSLKWLCDDATAAGHRIVRFCEPDLGFELTAAALEPAAHRLVSRLPLALARWGEVKHHDRSSRPEQPAR